MDAPDVNKKFAESLEVDYPILSDPDKGVATAYGVVTGVKPLASRWTYYIGKDGKILFIDKQVNPSTAGKDVAAKLAELGVARRK